MAEFKHIKEIDLAGNLLCSWKEAFNIMLEFPLLENFSLAHNFVRDIDASSISGVSFENMKVLNHLPLQLAALFRQNYFSSFSCFCETFSCFQYYD